MISHSLQLLTFCQAPLFFPINIRDIAFSLSHGFESLPCFYIIFPPQHPEV